MDRFFERHIPTIVLVAAMFISIGACYYVTIVQGAVPVVHEGER